MHFVHFALNNIVNSLYVIVYIVIHAARHVNRETDKKSHKNDPPIFIHFSQFSFSDFSDKVKSIYLIQFT